MPKVVNKSSDHPEGLRPFLFHGVDLVYSAGDKEAIGDCPSCGKESKFYVNTKTSQYRCWSCDFSGEKFGFLRWLWKESFESTLDYGDLAKSRGLLQFETLIAWGVCKSVLTGDWLVPAYGPEGKLNQLYRYIKIEKGMRLLPTPTIGHYLFQPSQTTEYKPVVIICEGPWDGMALWESMRYAKNGEEALEVTRNSRESLLTDCSVIAAPGCQSFSDSWCNLFQDKIVNILFDSDHPRKNPRTNKLVAPAGLSGVKKAVEKLSGASKPPMEINYLKWGDDGYDPNLPSGTDLRDLLSDVEDLEDRIDVVGSILNRIAQADKSWHSKRPAGGTEDDSEQLTPEYCDSYRVLVGSWRKALKWTDGLDHALSAMLASIVSTRIVGDQLWLKIIGPASCGKSTLCEAVSVNSKYVLAKSTIRGFHSGFNSGDSSQDNSLIAQLYNKTLVTKDGDTLLQSPNLSQILSEARDLYDSTSRTHYRNAMSRDYSGVRMTWLLCGTSSLRAIDSSELGERFLDCVIMDGIDDELEDEILWRVANRTNRVMSMESNGEASSHHEPNMMTAMKLTGGYIDYLRENASELMAGVTMSDDAIRMIIRLGKFVAYMRARPSTRQDETAEREFAARLVSQHIRLAKCIAAVLQRRTVDDEVMRRVKKIALDTSRGSTMEVVKLIYDAGEEGMEITKLCNHTNRTADKMREILRFLQLIGAIESFTKVNKKGIKGRAAWRLKPNMTKLYSDVMSY